MFLRCRQATPSKLPYSESGSKIIRIGPLYGEVCLIIRQKMLSQLKTKGVMFLFVYTWVKEIRDNLAHIIGVITVFFRLS